MGIMPHNNPLLCDQANLSGRFASQLAIGKE